MKAQAGPCIDTAVFPQAGEDRSLLILTASISARMVKISSADLDAEIVRALEEVLQRLGVDRGGLLEVSEHSDVLRVSHAWYAEGITRVSGEVNLAALFPWSYRHIVIQGHTLALKNCQNDLPPEADADRESHRLFGNKSTLTIPLFIGQRVHHLVTVDTHRVERDWPDDVITCLRLLGEIFVSALQRREAEQALLFAKERLDMAAASADAGLWELELSTGVIWATDKARNMFHYPEGVTITLANFLDKVHADDRQLIVDAVEKIRCSGGELRVEYRSAGLGGETRWMQSLGRLAENAGGFPHYLLGVTQEITARKMLEQQLKEQLVEIRELQERLEQENIYLRNEVASRENRIGISASMGSRMQKITAQVEAVAHTASTVLVLGETGTGKELVAEIIHRLSPRSKKTMIKVNCAALPHALVESELFGRERGAFTGALSRQVGRFELADDSTLFLDEISEMPLDTQVKLLRVLQEGEFERLGSPKPVRVDVRIIAASNCDLRAEVEKGRFRQDLYYRLNVFPIVLPPLREHPEEIPQLVWEFVAEFGEKMGKRIRRVDSRDMERLKAYPWPGNVRELRNIIERAMIVSRSDILELQSLSADSLQSTATLTLEDVERRHIRHVLELAGGKVKGPGGAAERLDINPSTLNSRMQKLGIRPRRH